jgi:hypothetical protein
MDPSIKRIYSIDSEAFEPPKTPENKTFQRTESRRSLSHLSAWHSVKIAPKIGDDRNNPDFVRSISSLDSPKQEMIAKPTENKAEEIEQPSPSTPSCCAIS